MALAAAPRAPRIEHHPGPGPVLGIGTPAPRLSWTVPTAEPGYVQTAYEVEVSRRGTPRRFTVSGSEQVLVPWPAPPLTSREEAAVRVRVAHGEDWSAWSPPTVVEAGLLATEDWSAAFISPADIGGLDAPAPVLAATIDITGTVVRARLYATAHGVYVPTLNGRRLDDQVLAPGWTSYEHRLRYQSYDVTELVHSGANTLEVLLGNGWYRGRLGWGGARALYGDRLAALAQLEITTDDGRVHVLATDGSWTARESGVVADDLYDGQSTDLRLERGPHPVAGPVDVVEGDLSRLVAPDGPPIRVTGELPAQRIWTSPSGRMLVDFGQNAVGWVRLTVRGHAEGTEVTVRHAEVLEDGELGTRPLRSARATDTYVLAGPEETVLEPSLTFHGFRYAEVSGAPGLNSEDVELVVVGSDLRRAGWFESSDELLDRLHENVVWSMRGNFVDVPIDCPQRDERLGWTGDIQVFAPTATYLFDTAGFLASWLGDLAAEQLPDGTVPHVVHDVVRTHVSQSPAAAWGDAATVVPWTLYQRTGDDEVLARQLPSMQAWVDKMADLAGEQHLWTGGFQYGDWLDPTAPPEDPFRARADPDAVATAHLARSAQIVADAAAVLGRHREAEKYAALAERVRDAFARTYVTATGRVLSDSQTVYALAIEWGLLPHQSQRDEAGDNLADLVRGSGFRISTGFVGTPLICDALTTAGHADVANRLLLQTGCPSWLYPVTMGATTIWERWDSMLPDGSINPGEMTSFNHYALGAVADWLHRSVAGLAPAAPGYRRLVVEPQLATRLQHAATRHLTPYGEAAVSWRRHAGRLTVDVEVPVGARASVHLPGVDDPVEVEHGHHQWVVHDPVGEDPARAGGHEPSTVRDLLDDPDLWGEVVDVATADEVTSAGEPEAARRLLPYLDAPVSVVPRVLAPEDRFPHHHDTRRRLAAVVHRDTLAAHAPPVAATHGP